jgi:hypothetical protein
MGRTVSAVVTWGDTYLGVIGPFPVSVPWWAEAEPVVTHLREVLDVPVLVLRLLGVEGGEGGRDGHVTYHVAALDRPAPGLLEQRPVDHGVLNGPEELRSPWATLGGLNEVLNWASDALATAGRPLTGAAEQRRTWNLATLFRLPTGKGPVWLKTTPRFAADEASVIAAFARVDPTLVPPVVVDWADAHFGNPVLDGLRACDFLPAAKRPAAARAWIDAWASRIPGCEPARALSIAEPLAHLIYAVRYQEFLDGIEPSERIYHLGDPAAAIRAALRSALAEEQICPGGDVRVCTACVGAGHVDLH